MLYSPTTTFVLKESRSVMSDSPRAKDADQTPRPNADASPEPAANSLILEPANAALASGFQDILGYLNFSSGKPDVKFQDRLNRCHPEWGWPNPWESFEAALLARLAQLETTSPAFRDSSQARAVLQITFHHLWPAYRKHHADLLFHLTDADFQQPLFLARLFEAVLAQGSPWEETDRVVQGALESLNDFVGFRPVAVLENDRRMEPYPHERFRPIPLYIQGVGAGRGPYQELITRTMQLMQAVPANLLQDAYFDLRNLDEIACDVRAHDHNHPVYKRTNYMFGEWDPHLIDSKGFYRRFVLRKIILDSLLSWMAEQHQQPHEESLFDAAAVLCGTMLMASAISGAGPETHDSTVTLTSLLPKVARQRDVFYERLLDDADGARALRLHAAAKKTQQPFGHVRQALNLYLANYGARQIQYRHLAGLYALLGQAQPARETAMLIPSVAARFACEVHWRITAANRHLSAGELLPAVSLIAEIEDHFKRGIECGAFPDPWNILGFQGQFPLFSSREDSIPDQRLEEMLSIVEQYLALYSRALSESAAQGDQELTRRLSDCFRAFAEYWDQFASVTVEDLPRVAGRESWESATHVASVLSEWRAAGEAAGDVSFWRRHIDKFTTAKSYALVVKALLEKQDYVAAMALLMQWLSQKEEVGIEAGSLSLPALLSEWMTQVTAEPSPSDRWPDIRRFFAYLEVNAGEFWDVPTLGEFADAVAPQKSPPRPADSLHDNLEEEFGEDSQLLSDESMDDEDDLFRSAYEDVSFRDSADDGVTGELLEDGKSPGSDTMDYISKSLEPRLKFSMTIAQAWQSTVAYLMRNPPAGLQRSPKEARRPEIEDPQAVIGGWVKHLGDMQDGLRKLMNRLWEFEIATPSGEHDSNVEYDMQLQTKLYLLQTVVAVQIACRIAERGLACFLPGVEARKRSKTASEDMHLTALYRAVLRGDIDEVKATLPSLLTTLARKPLLYVPLDAGGNPKQVLAARLLQSDIRFLLRQLPRLGLLKETWHLLRTAHRMEKSSRPGEMAVTEFDRLFRTAVRSSVDAVLRSAVQWENGRFSQEKLVELLHSLMKPFVEEWVSHSLTMRLSAVEGMKRDDIWQEVCDFITKYGGELFHAKMLTLGNVRAILHNGITWFLNFLAESQDPQRPSPLLEALDNGTIDTDHVVHVLELIYSTVVDKFDRFLEYNTTTTQSDYGEKFYYLLDFLRVEADYDRDAWNFTPLNLVHEVLCQWNLFDAVAAWERSFDKRARQQAAGHLRRLRAAERKYGMRLPAISDRLNERFTKPLAVNRMLALLPKVVAESPQDEAQPTSFELLRREIDRYLADSVGSGIELPAWMQNLEKEVLRLKQVAVPGSPSDAEFDVTPRLMTLEQVSSQLDSWLQLTPKKRTPKKKPPEPPA
jgi:hypothetical protein